MNVPSRWILAGVASWGFNSTHAQSQEELTLAKAKYHQCLSLRPGANCDDLYQPILQFCRDRINDCQSHVEAYDLGALSFLRCKSRRSCQLGAGWPGYLSLSLQPTSERSEVRDPYESIFGGSIQYRFGVRIPSGSVLETQNQSMVIAHVKAMNSQSPVFALRLKSANQLTVTLRHQIGEAGNSENGQEVIIPAGEIPRDYWHALTVQLKTGQYGWLHVTINGSTVADYRGPLGYRDLSNYLKLGPYDYTKTQITEFRIDYTAISRSL